MSIHLAKVEPWNVGVPAIHGPDLTGASAGKPILYTIPATGERPMTFEVEGLPAGLHLDSASGQITGQVAKEGDYRLLLKASNRHGQAEKEFALVVGKGIALTPPMGWNSWNAWRHWVADHHIRAAADELIKHGLAARGYSYVNVDSCWQGVRGGKHHAIQPNAKFQDMKALVDYVHGRGLRFGIYSTPWTQPWGCTPEVAMKEWGGPALIGCSQGEQDMEYEAVSSAKDHFVGKEKLEANDVAQWVEWKVDYLKYDWMPTDTRCMERMGRILQAASRDIVFSLCTDVRLKDAQVHKQWAHMWRGHADTNDNWANLKKLAFLNEDLFEEDWRPYVGPGGWYDMDMFALGPQFQDKSHSTPCKLTLAEQVTEMTFWAVFPSPLFLSCDLSALTEMDVRLFANEEVLAVNQDRLGIPGVRLREERTHDWQRKQPARSVRIISKQLHGGRFAVGFFNLAPEEATVTLDWRDLELSGRWLARDVWERRDLGGFDGSLSLPVPGHGARMVTIKQ